MKKPTIKALQEEIEILRNQNADLRSKIGCIVRATYALPYGANDDATFTAGDSNRVAYLAGYRLGKIEAAVNYR